MCADKLNQEFIRDSSESCAQVCGIYTDILPLCSRPRDTLNTAACDTVRQYCSPPPYWASGEPYTRSGPSNNTKPPNTKISRFLRTGTKPLSGPGRVSTIQACTATGASDSI